ncbi:MAG: DUF5013 domain-containing protein [Flavobacterium sp.]
MKKYKTLYKGGGLTFLLLSVVFLLFSCSEEGPKFREFPYPEPAVTGISPAEGYAAIYDTIKGSNFGILPKAVKVYYGGIKADSIISCVDNMIVVKVPNKALSGKVSMQIWTHILDSIGSYHIIPSPEIYSVASSNAGFTNVAFSGIDIVTIKGINFGTDVSKVKVKFSGTPATIISLTDNTITVATPDGYLSGFISVTMTKGGLKLISPTAMINPNAAGDITPYFLKNTGNTASGGQFVANTDALANNRWGTLGAPWITNAGVKNKTNAASVKVGGWASDKNPNAGTLCFETWGNTPIVDGKVYQQTALALPIGNYTISFKYASENKPTSSVYCIVAAGNGLPSLGDLNTSIAYADTWNSTPVGTTSPNSGPTIKSFNFDITTPQKVSIGFLVNMTGAVDKADYFNMPWIKLVKN